MPRARIEHSEFVLADANSSNPIESLRLRPGLEGAQSLDQRRMGVIRFRGSRPHFLSELATCVICQHSASVALEVRRKVRRHRTAHHRVTHLALEVELIEGRPEGDLFQDTGRD